MKKGKLVSDAKQVSSSGQKVVGKQVAMFSGAMTTQSTMEE
jgi:hypothetical protein